MTSNPKRIQMTRSAPWRKEHPTAIIVDRRTHWGNPFIIGEPGVPDAETAVELFKSAIFLVHWARQCVMAEPSTLHQNIMMDMPGPIPRLDAIQRELRGRDLACWCGLDQACHGDTLLALANGPHHE